MKSLVMTGAVQQKVTVMLYTSEMREMVGAKKYVSANCQFVLVYVIQNGLDSECHFLL